MTSVVSRREFLGGMVAATGAVGTPRPAVADADETKPVSPLIASAPVLQNAAGRSMGVAFAVNADASGWVDISMSPDMGGAKRVYSGGLGMMEVNDKVAQILVRGLRPATRYWYRIGADRIDYKGGYQMRNLGPEVDPKVHSFTTLGEEAQGSFCVINDTHERRDALKFTFSKLAELRPSVVIWNGDAINKAEDMQRAMNAFVHTHEDFPEYAADTPFMFLNGNHDFRGRFARHLERVWMFRDPAERSGRFSELGRNFVQRLGGIALIGLDTGEDKPDDYLGFAGIFQMERYRDLQTEWLAEEIEKPVIKTAKFKVVICHIPMFHARASDPDVPAGDGPIRGRCAAWSRPCAKRWLPLLEKAGVDLVVVGHRHSFHVDETTTGRTWMQIVGGGCDPDPKNSKGFPSIVEGRVVDGRLVIRVHNCTADKIVMEKEFG